MASATSVIITVLNEGQSIRGLLDSLAAQTQAPDEIVIVDGGSRDDTAAIIREYMGRLPIKLIVEDGCNISRGRNRAIAEAQGDILAITDAGVRLDPQWLAHLSAPLRADPQCQAVAGWFQADPQTLFEAAMGATVLPLLDEINPSTFLPSSRSVAVRRSAALAVGGYPEWLDYCEDLIFDMGLRARFGPFVFAPQAIAHFRPRGSWRAFYKQYYLYARGDGKAGLWTKRHIIRYSAYGLALPLLLALGAVAHPVFWGLLVAGGLVYVRAPYRRLPIMLRRYGARGALAWGRAVALVPLIRLVGDVAKMLGYPAGLIWRARHHPPNWRATTTKTKLRHD